MSHRKDLDDNLEVSVLVTETIPRAMGLSFYWDVLLPLGLTGVPVAIWTLLRWVSSGLDKPAAHVPGAIIVAMLALQTAGLVALAFVALMRRDMATVELHRMFPHGPARWRTVSLVMAVMFLALFDILTNMAAAFPGAEFLLFGGIPLYFAYLVFVRFALFHNSAPTLISD